MASVWDRLAAPGSDPELVRRLLARLVSARGGPRALAADAAALALRSESSAHRLVRALAVVPGAEAMRAAERAAETWVLLGVRAAVVGDPAYPARLGAGWPATAAPALLAWRGPPSGVAAAPMVAIVGARRATGYGTAIAAWLAGAAADAGVVVVSGGAVGIDAAAHRATLHRPGATIAVLGCGHDVAYPRPHAGSGGLFDQVLGQGGWLVGELPPGAPPAPHNVLARNRIVAGLADAVVVVEGGERSGALTTAAAAADRGVAVLAVPGDVRAPGSAAPHRLLAEGAAPCTSPADLLAVLQVESSRETDAGGAPTCLPTAVRDVLARRWPRPLLIDDLALATGVPTGRLLGLLTRARVAGEVADGPDGVRLRRAP